MCTAHVLMRYCHRVDRSFVCKAKEGRHARILILPRSSIVSKVFPPMLSLEPNIRHSLHADFIIPNKPWLPIKLSII